MKRLFVIRERKQGPLVRETGGGVRYFENKSDAKEARNQLKLPLAVVSLGPDHKKCRRQGLKSVAPPTRVWVR